MGQKYITDTFQQDLKSTIGADFHTKELPLENKTITLQIWDTAGQERFQSLGNAFYRGADACILVYDITDTNSFEQIEDWKTKFINQAQIDTPKEYPFLLLANKTDMDSQRKVSPQQGKEYAATNNMAFYETSAKDGTNIREAVRNIASTASDQPTVPFFHEEVVAEAMKNYNTQNEEVESAQSGGCACNLL